MSMSGASHNGFHLHGRPPAAQRASADMQSNTIVSTATTPISKPGMEAAQLQKYEEPPHSGLYGEVVYPLATMYCPPKPPSDKPVRVQPPARPGRVWKNDIDMAGEREHHAQREVSRMWRGIQCRRQLRMARTYDHVLNNRALSIQCFWRAVCARKRRQQLATMKEEWIHRRTNDYIEYKTKNVDNLLVWQRRRFDGAATVIQRVVRWFLRCQARMRCRIQGVPLDEWPEEMEFPLKSATRPYFPWRRSTVGKDRSVANATSITPPTSETGQCRTLLQFKKIRDPFLPPPQEEVEKINRLMRLRNKLEEDRLAAPEVLSRQEWKRDGLRQQDLDFNAGVLQRMYRSRFSKVKVRGGELTAAYMENVARIIARAFRVYMLIQSMNRARAIRDNVARESNERYARARIDEVKEALVWDRKSLNQCAITIQRCYRWYRFCRFGELPPAASGMLNDCDEINRVEEESTWDGSDPHESCCEQVDLPSQLSDVQAAISEELPEGMGADVRRETPSDVLEVRSTAEGDRYLSEEDALQGQKSRSTSGDAHETTDAVPSAPPYHLIDHLIERHRRLQDATLNSLQKNEMNALTRKYSPYVPEKTLLKVSKGVFV